MLAYADFENVPKSCEIELVLKDHHYKSGRYSQLEPREEGFLEPIMQIWCKDGILVLVRKYKCPIDDKKEEKEEFFIELGE